ncbi:Hypothetical predicted protein [Cloeon dipterum]|uniref:SAC3/GANP/THP3 conserved domain-containing protein n=1 Tax=Cloeon dipterum TaxID=197152 RepID=A0A8S1BYN0_9INSE|nr:Hypothetical predicted protein [Cloeon dipterum]
MSSLGILGNFIHGTCEEMCPKSELEFRQRQRLLHPLEMKAGTIHHKPPLADPLKTVKEYSRSAAGVKAENADQLRPLPVLERTTIYLIRLALEEQDLCGNWSTIYDFVADRLRAVRKDIVIQGLSGRDVLPILEVMVLFHLYAGYRLCELKVSQFDPKLNNDMLIDCVRRVLDTYDYGFTSRNQLLLESIFALHDINRTEGVVRLLSSKARSKLTEDAIQMFILYSSNNYARLFRSLQDLPAPLACAMAQHLPSVRRNAFNAMSVAYSSKILKVPVQWLSSLLLLSCEEVRAEAKNYGVKQEADFLQFSKGNFNFDSKPVPCTRLKELEIESKMQVFIKKFLVQNFDLRK